MGRFRVRLGEAEVEYEGEDSESKYQEALDWLSEAPQKRTGEHGKTAKAEDLGAQGSKRGGIRSAVVAPKIDQLIKEDWFSKHRSVEDTMTELKRLVVPGVNRVSVTNALRRRVGKTLDTVMDGEVQVFWASKKSAKSSE